MSDGDNTQSPNKARIAMTVLGLISVGLSLICGLFLLYYGLSVQGFPTVGLDGGPTAELLIAFTFTGGGFAYIIFSVRIWSLICLDQIAIIRNLIHLKNFYS